MKKTMEREKETYDLRRKRVGEEILVKLEEEFPHRDPILLSNLVSSLILSIPGLEGERSGGCR